MNTAAVLLSSIWGWLAALIVSLGLGHYSLVVLVVPGAGGDLDTVAVAKRRGRLVAVALQVCTRGT